MDKNKIVTIIVALIWLVVVILKGIGMITITQFRIILFIVLILYVIFFYRQKIFNKKK